MDKKKEFISNIDYNKSPKAYLACSLECKKMDKRINDRELPEIKLKEVPHILKVFNF